MAGNKFGTAVILAGGKSSRMGFNKEFLELNGESLIKRNIAILKNIFNEVIVVTNNPEYYSELDVVTIQDIYFQRGPLSGIHAALKRASSEYIYLLACDMPNLDGSFILYLMDTVNATGAEIVIGKAGEKLEPFNGFYSKSILARVEKLLEQEKLAIKALISESRAEFIDIQSTELEREIFLNLNTQQDLKHYIKSEKEKS